MNIVVDEYMEAAFEAVENGKSPEEAITEFIQGVYTTYERLKALQKTTDAPDPVINP